MRIRHFEVVRALERLLEVGVPVWETEAQQFAWHLKQLSQCEPFLIPMPEEFEGREEMQAHAENCSRCQPAYVILQQAVDWGSGRTGDKDLKELIVRSHEDPTAARQYYESVRNATFGAMAAATVEKPTRGAKREQVPA